MPHEVIHPAQPLQSAQGGSNTSTERTRSSQAVKPADLVQTMPHSRAPATTGRRSLIVKLKFLSTSDFAKIVSQHEGSSNDVQPSGSVVRADAIPNPRSSTARLEPKYVFCTTTSPRKTNSTTPLDEETPRVMHDISDLSSSEQSDPLLSDDSDTSDMPETGLLDIRIEAEVEKIEALVESAQKQLQAWQEMFVQAELRQATIDARTCHRPRLDPSAKDPFRAVTEQRRKSAAGAGGVKPGSEIAQAGHVHGHKPHERFHNKKLTAVRVPERPFYTEATLLPKYKSIGRISSSFLAPNYRTAKYRPYDAEDEVQDPDATEKYFELEQRFKNNYPSLKSQRECQELVWLWKPWAKRIFSSLGIRNTDVLYFFTQDRFDPGRELVGYYDWSPESAKAWREEQMRRCKTCELADPESRCIHFSETFNSLPKPDDRSLAFAGLVAHAFHRVSGVSLWHVALGGLLQPRYEDPQAMTKTTPGLCVICFRHRCPDHGSYEDPIEDDHGTKEGAEELKAFINDEEQDHNLRKFMALPIRNKHDDHHHHATAAAKHVCGVFCVDPSQTLPNLIGRQSNGDVAGDSRAAAVSQPTRNILADDEFCSTSCFWDVSRRRDIKVSEVKFQPFMSQSQKLLVDRLIGFYLNNKRGPCLISRIIKDVSCVMVFQYMVYRIAQYPHPAADSGATSDSSTHRHHQGHMRKKNKKALQPLVDVSRSAELDQRPPFVPCSHDGPCHNNPACSCFKSKVHCERFCGCDQSCKRRFRGCTCTMRGNKVCFKDSRCECWKLNRECDPALCGRCGVVDVLDSANKYNDEIRRGRCRNNRIQLGLPAPTSKAPSQVQGYGLYSRADIASGEFIGEYTGEIVSISEGDRRGAMYHVLNQEYLFVINKSQEIDASNNGNKMRFMNNSQREDNINVEPKKLLCSGVVRVGLFAKRSIKAGEELLYNYNYPEEVVRNFWEPGERPSGERRLIPVGPDHIARTTGTNKLADEMVNEAHEESSQSPLSRPPKRKRSGVESDFTARGLQEAYIAYQRQRHRVAAKYGYEDESDGSIYDLPTAPEIDDSQDSDYDTNGQGYQSEESNVGEYSEDRSDQEAFQVPSARPRRSSHRHSLGGGGRSSERGESTRKGSATSRSRDRRGPQPGSHSKGTRTTSPGGARKGSQLAAVKRKRKIGPHDRRLGGRAQQQAWRTRRLKESLGLSVSPNPASKSRDN
ncbi:Histone-lysine N-methyltransferase EZH2 [Exophiala dermatitidis]